MELTTKELISIITIFMSATGFWKIIEIYLIKRYERRRKSLEMTNLNVQTNNLIVENWIEWSSKLEGRIKVLESYLDEVKSENRELLKKIERLKNEVQKLKNENLELLENRKMQSERINELELEVAELKGK